MDPVTKNLRALQGALEHSLTIQRTRVQEIIDELVARGTLSRTDADGLIGQLLASSKDYSQALLQVLESVTALTRKSISAGIEPVMATAGKLAETVLQAPLMPKKVSAQAPKAVPKPAAAKSTKPTKPTESAEPIAGYAGMNVGQVKARLAELDAAQLRALRKIELAGKARKTVLSEIARRIDPTSK